MAQQQNTSVSLGEHFTGFISSQVRDGRYNSASDVIRAALRLLEEREGKMRALRRAIDEGLASPSEPFDTASFREEMRQKHGPR